MTKQIQAVKIIDPIVQSLLLIFFAICIDIGNYLTALYILLGWQVLSAIVNAFISSSRKKVIERTVNFIVLLIYFGVFLYLRKVKEVYIDTITGEGEARIPLHETIMVCAGAAIAFWYYVICFREVRSILKKKRKKKR